MPHTLIVGVTESGKSTYAKLVCEGLKSRGFPTAVLNPYGDPTWKADFQTANADELLEYCRQPFKKAVFLEEADCLAKEPRFNWFTCAGRHAGCQIWVVAQRLQMLSPALRNNCTESVVFCSETVDTQILANRYREPLLAKVGRFRKGQFFILSQFADTRIGLLDFAKRQVYIKVVPKC